MFDESEIDDFSAGAERVTNEKNAPASLPYLQLWSQFVATITPFSEVNLDPQEKATLPHLILRH